MINELIITAKDLSTIEEFLVDIEVPTNLDPSYFAGELKDLLSELTSSYSYVSTLVDEANYIVALLGEGIELRTNDCIKQLRKSSAATPSTKKERLNSIRNLVIGSLEICGIQVMKSCSIQDIIEYKLKCEYLRDRLKSMLATIDKSMNVGNTVLSYNKQELAKMYNAT